MTNDVTTLQIPVDTRSRRDAMSLRLRSALAAGDSTLAAIREYVVRVPAEDEHSNHYVGPVCCIDLLTWY